MPVFRFQDTAWRTANLASQTCTQVLQSRTGKYNTLLSFHALTAWTCACATPDTRRRCFLRRLTRCAFVWADCTAVYAWMKKTLNLRSDQIILYGKSLGTAATIDLATRMPAMGRCPPPGLPSHPRLLEPQRNTPACIAFASHRFFFPLPSHSIPRHHRPRRPHAAPPRVCELPLPLSHFWQLITPSCTPSRRITSSITSSSTSSRLFHLIPSSAPLQPLTRDQHARHGHVGCSWARPSLTFHHILSCVHRITPSCIPSHPILFPLTYFTTPSFLSPSDPHSHRSLLLRLSGVILVCPLASGARVVFPKMRNGMLDQVCFCVRVCVFFV